MEESSYYSLTLTSTLEISSDESYGKELKETKKPEKVEVVEKLEKTKVDVEAQKDVRGSTCEKHGCLIFWSCCCSCILLIAMIIFFLLGNRVSALKYNSIDGLKETPCEWSDSQMVKGAGGGNMIATMKVGGKDISFCFKRLGSNAIRFRKYGIKVIVNTTECGYYEDTKIFETWKDRFDTFKKVSVEPLKPVCEITSDRTNFSFKSKEYEITSGLTITVLGGLIGFIILFILIIVLIIIFICCIFVCLK